MSLIMRWAALATLVAAPLAAQVPTPPTAPTPPAPPSHPSKWRSWSDDDDDDSRDARQSVRDAMREASREAADAAREAAHEARESIAEAMPEIRAERDAMHAMGPQMRDLSRDLSRQWQGGHHNAYGRGGDDDDDESTIDTTLAFAATGGVVDLGVVSGEITVRGWSRAEARVHASSESGPIDFEHSAARISLDVHRGHGDSDCEFDLTVPYGTRVLMRSNSGDLHYLAVKGEMEARTISGGVDISDTKGMTSVETVSGDIRARDIAGNLRVNTISGGVELATVTGDVDVSTVSGDIGLPDGRSRVVRMESVSGTEIYGGAIDPAGRYDFHSHSGDITLRMPADVNASLSLQTFSGEIDSDFKLTLTPARGSVGRPQGHHIDTTIGNGGGAHVTIETFSGDVRLERRTRTSE